MTSNFKKVVNKNRNILIILLCFFSFMSTYFLKLSFNTNIIKFEEAFNVTHSDAGKVVTAFFFAYGFSQIFNGFFIKKYPLRFVVPGCLLLSCVLNFLTMISTSFNIIILYWFLDGLILALLWPCTIRTVAENVDEKYKNLASLFMAVTTGMGTVLVYLLSSLFVYLDHFKLIFVVAISLGIIFSLLWFIFYPKLKKDNVVEIKTEKAQSKVNITPAFVFFLVCFGIISLVSSLSRDGITTWFPSIVNEKFNLSSHLSVLITVLLPIGQIIGSLLSLLIHKIFKDCLKDCIFLLFIAAISIFIGLILQTDSLTLTVIFVMVSNCCLSGINKITTSYIPIKAKFLDSGLLASLLNGCCYLGSVISTYGMGVLADNYGWNISFKIIFIILVSVAGISLLISLLKLLKIKII